MPLLIIDVLPCNCRQEYHNLSFVQLIDPLVTDTLAWDPWYGSTILSFLEAKPLLIELISDSWIVLPMADLSLPQHHHPVRNTRMAWSPVEVAFI